MTDAMENVLAVPDKRAADLAGITMRQLRYWEQVRLIVPGIRRQLSARNIVRLYTYPELVELLVAAQIRKKRGFSLQHIRRVVDHLRSRNYDAPLRQLKFATDGGQIYFQHPDGSWEGDLAPHQTIMHWVIDLDDVRAIISRATVRSPATAGKVVRKRGVHGSKPIFAGTRIPVATVRRFLDAGFDAPEILEEYPSLTDADVEAARRYTLAS